MTERVTDLCERLHGEIPQDSSLAARPYALAGEYQLLAALDRNSQFHLLVRIKTNDTPAEDRRSRGLVVETREFVLPDAGSGRFIDIECRDARGHDALNSLAADLTASLATGMSPATAVTKAVARWRAFWATVPSQALSPSEQLGLFGELWFLNFWLAEAVGMSAAVLAWRGPHGARHDFEFPALSVEAKTTSAVGPCIHTINGLDQLEAPESGELFLFSLRVREELGATNSLPLLVSLVRAAAQSAGVSEAFETALARLGYSAVHESEYSGRRLRLVETMAYRVAGSFPRLTRRELSQGIPNGVSGVSYLIDLAAAGSFKIAETPSELRTLLGRSVREGSDSHR